MKTTSFHVFTIFLVQQRSDVWENVASANVLFADRTKQKRADKANKVVISEQCLMLNHATCTC